jgi:hypothetical protein
MTNIRLDYFSFYVRVNILDETNARAKYKSHHQHVHLGISTGPRHVSLTIHTDNDLSQITRHQVMVFCVLNKRAHLNDLAPGKVTKSLASNANQPGLNDSTKRAVKMDDLIAI